MRQVGQRVVGGGRGGAGQVGLDQDDIGGGRAGGIAARREASSKGRTVVA
ncbi:hypothetical protein ACFQ2B_05035 [Streptomyces stramineus]